MRLYLLDGKDVKPCDDILKFAECFGSNDNTVRKTTIGRYLVSTVFIGIDTYFFGDNFDSDREPAVFETMVFQNNDPEVRDESSREDFPEFFGRHRTWEEAEQAHVEACNAVRQAIK